MDGKWIEWMWKVASGAVPDLTQILALRLKKVIGTTERLYFTYMGRSPQ